MATAITTPATADAVAFARRMVAAIEAHDVEALVALYGSNPSQLHPFADGIVEGVEAIRAGDGALVRAFPDVRVERRHEAATGRTVFMEAVLRMTFAQPLELEDGAVVEPNGQPVELPLVWVVDLDEDGQIIQERSYLDSAAFYRQLGIGA